MAGGQQTFVAGNVLTAAQVNAYLMDQALMRVTSGTRPTAAAQGGALLTGMSIVETDNLAVCTYNGTNWIQTTTEAASVTTSETTTSGAFTNLATVGPSVTITTGTAAMVFLECAFGHTTVTAVNNVGFAVSGASTIAAQTISSIMDDQTGASGVRRRFGGFFRVTGLTAGANTFTMRYVTNAATATFSDRHIAAIGLMS